METRKLAAFLILAIIACQPDAEPAGGPDIQERDSAGIQIVENPRPPDGSRLGWRIGSEPAVSIGVLEGDDPYMLFAVRDATILSDGRIVVVGANELRVFDPMGIYLETWGGRGEGPGEFIDLHQADPWLGDSIVAGDMRHETMTVFDSDGKLRPHHPPGGFSHRQPASHLRAWPVHGDAGRLDSACPGAIPPRHG